jgi:ribosomal-protein-alanine N-acetyltransferase
MIEVERQFDQPSLQTERLILKPLAQMTPSALVDYFKRNRSHFDPYFTLKPGDFDDEAYWRTRIAQATSP